MENQSYDQFVKKINTNINVNTHAYISFNNLHNLNYSFKFKTVPYKRNYNITQQTDLITQTKYYIINQLMKGDQWTLINDIESEKRKNQGFKIEVFGSPFNARLPYFGSLFDTDEPFGRIGDAFEILEKLQKKEPLYWREELIFGSEDNIKITINPPSSYEIQSKVFKYLYNITQTRKIECYLDMKGKLYTKFLEGKRENKYVEYLFKLLENTSYTVKQYDLAYDLYNSTKPTKLSSPWSGIFFKNKVSCFKNII